MNEQKQIVDFLIKEISEKLNENDSYKDENNNENYWYINLDNYEFFTNNGIKEVNITKRIENNEKIYSIGYEYIEDPKNTYLLFDFKLDVEKNKNFTLISYFYDVNEKDSKYNSFNQLIHNDLEIIFNEVFENFKSIE